MPATVGSGLAPGTGSVGKQVTYWVGLLQIANHFFCSIFMKNQAIVCLHIPSPNLTFIKPIVHCDF